MIWLLGGLGAAGGAVLLAVRPYAFYFVVFLIITMLAGMAQYYAHIDAAPWVGVLAAVALLGRDWIENRAARRRWRAGGSPAMYVLAAFFIWALFVAFINRIPQAQLLVAIKNYALIWAVAPVVGHLASRRLFYSRVEFALVGLMLLQGPVCFAQRLTAKHWDAVVGTFGGDPNAGGSSGTLMLYCVAGVLFGVSIWQRGKAPLWAAVTLLILSFVIVSFGEVKAFFFLLPLGLLIQQRRRAMRSPVQTALIAGVLGICTYIVVGLYSSEYTVTATREDQITTAVESFFDPNYVSEGGELTRGASIAIWSRYAGPGVMERAVGYGPGSSRSSSTVSVGALVTRFGGMRLDTTAISQLLWDTGVIGLLLYLAVFIVALVSALRISRHAVNRTVRSRADALAALFSVAIPMFIYDRSLIDIPTTQFLFATALGLLAALERTQTQFAARSPSSKVPGSRGSPVTRRFSST